jgi:hypothetical protein
MPGENRGPCPGQSPRGPRKTDHGPRSAQLALLIPQDPAGPRRDDDKQGAGNHKQGPEAPAARRAGARRKPHGNGPRERHPATRATGHGPRGAIQTGNKQGPRNVDRGPTFPGGRRTGHGPADSRTDWGRTRAGGRDRASRGGDTGRKKKPPASGDTGGESGPGAGAVSGSYSGAVQALTGRRKAPRYRSRNPR